MTMTDNRPSGPMHGDGYLDEYLTNFAVDRVNDTTNATETLATAVFPIVPVRRQGAKFKVWPRGSFLRPEMRPKPYGGKPVEGTYKTEEANYYAEHWAVEKVVDHKEYENAGNASDPELGAVRWLVRQRRLALDLAFTEHYFKRSVWTFGFRGSSNPNNAEGEFLKWDESGSNPVRVLRNAARYMQRATEYMPNVAVFGADAFEVALDHLDIRDRVKYTSLGRGTEDALKELFGVDRIIVSGSTYNAAPEGLADDMRFTVPTTGILLAYANPNPNAQEPSAGYTFSWDKFGGADTTPNAMSIRRGTDERAQSDWFQGHTAFDMKVVSPDMGVFFENVVSPLLAGNGTRPTINFD